MDFDFQYMLEVIPNLLVYIPTTLYITVLSMVVAIIIGGLFAIILFNKVPVLSQLVQVLSSFFRGTPAIVQLLLAYFGLPQIIPALTSMTATQASILALSLNTAAYLAEVFRAALASVDAGQVEAAMSVGLNYRQTLKGIILPQALRNALPGTGNTFVSLMKNASLAFTIGVVEIVAQGKILAAASLRFFEVYFAIALIYWGLTILYTWIQEWYEDYINKPYIR
ncbi:MULTISPECIES: amino acid ABC transporter permease [Lactobacillales]|uniref:amino acid ABC transporter permease n=1 Tax=Lactobacillales TaxID=186826 RepID=UPI00066118CC|nr:amino acid ABC transporter permease [Carnobacterium sp. 1290_CSPC]